MKVTASTRGMVKETTRPARTPRLTNADDEHDGDRLEQGFREAADGLFDDQRLVGDEVHADADRQLGLHLAHLRLQLIAELQQVAAGAHGDGEADRRLTIEAEQRLWRVGIAAWMSATSDRRKKRSLTRRLIALRLASETNWPPTRTETCSGSGLDDAGGRDGVLRLQRLDQRLEVDAEPGELAGREVEIDRLVLRADELGLADIRDVQHVAAHALHVVAQLAHREPVAGEGIDVAVDVAELIVEADALQASREGAADVAEVLAHLVEKAGSLRGSVVSLNCTKTVV